MVKIFSSGLTPANGSEREALWDVIGSIQGLLIGVQGVTEGLQAR
ncbi:hypothetical protein [Microcystis aeruginosa]|nr:hypothetical protein [Microcystis aeruginosa]